MFSKELGSKLIYLPELQELVGQQQEVAGAGEPAEREPTRRSPRCSETRSQTVAEYERGLLDELAKAEQKAAGLAQDVIKAEQRTSLQKLTAPVDGVVQQLAVHTIGGVVTPAQQLMVIVPADSRLEIEAMVSNRDIGFVEAGQEAAIKVDTFNFTRYGLLHGTVLSVSHDAISRDRPQDKQPRQAAAAPRPARASPRARSWSTPRASRSTARACRSRTRPSTCRPAWRSRSRSRPARAAS